MSAGTGTGRRALRLLRSDPLPPLPDAKALLDAENPRRPGELREALLLSSAAAERIAGHARKVGVTLDVAASLVLEAGLLSLRVPRLHELRDQSDPPRIALPEASAHYLRSLTVGRQSGQVSAQPSQTVAVPVRLVPQLGAVNPEQLIDLVPLEQAIAWEVAAIRAGQTMSEWVLERLLLER